MISGEVTGPAMRSIAITELVDPGTVETTVEKDVILVGNRGNPANIPPRENTAIDQLIPVNINNIFNSFHILQNDKPI